MEIKIMPPDWFVDPKIAERITACEEKIGNIPSRIAAFRKALEHVPTDAIHRIRIEHCADERTGRRFGNANCRKGRCAKIGYTTYRHQCWLVWS